MGDVFHSFSIHLIDIYSSWNCGDNFDFTNSIWNVANQENEPSGKGQRSFSIMQYKAIISNQNNEVLPPID